MENRSRRMALRCAALVALLVNIGFNYFYKFLPFIHKSVTEVSSGYSNLFTPAGYALGIWAVIYLSFLVYGIYQLLPTQRDRILYDRLSIPLIVANLLNIGWIILYTVELMGFSALIMTLTLLNALPMFVLVRNRIRDCEYSGWVGVPFSLYTAWITVAVIANVSQWLASLGRYSDVIGQLPWAVLMIIVTVILTFHISIKYSDWIFSAVITWALLSIWLANYRTNHIMALAALSAAIVLGNWSIAYAAWQVRKSLQPVDRD